MRQSFVESTKAASKYHAYKLFRIILFAFRGYLLITLLLALYFEVALVFWKWFIFIKNVKMAGFGNRIRTFVFFAISFSNVIHVPVWRS